MEPTTTTEFWSSDNDQDEVDMLLQRILFRFHEIIFYSNAFLGITLAIGVVLFIIGLGFVLFAQSRIGRALDVTAMQEQATKEKQMRKKIKRELKYL